MNNQKPLLSICIPAYNRASFLAPLLDSVFSQDFQDYEIVICEDGSPERESIAAIVHRYQAKHPGVINYEENANNLGYDGNIRRLIEVARGQYCVFLGNDDLLYKNALATIASAIHRHSECGIIVRTYATFEQNPDEPQQVFRYFQDERIIEAGAAAIYTAYRRSVVIPGMVICRDDAAAVATTRFDGTLLYQLYLVGMILAHRSVVFLPEILALRRNGILPDFGNSESECNKFVPHEQTPESSLHFMNGMINIAKYIEQETHLNVFSSIRADIGNYSYPILAIQANRTTHVFIKYGLGLAKLGFWRYPLFHFYFIGLLIFGTNFSNRIIALIKNYLGYTPSLGIARKKPK